MTNDQVPILEDFVQVAKVSTATVSRCLNTPEKVSEETRLRILLVV